VENRNLMNENEGRKTMILRKLRGWIPILAFCISSSLSVWAQGPDTGLDNGANYASVKQDLAVFQGVIDTTAKQTIQGFIPLLSSTKGIYLPEYGAVFSLEVNLYQIRPLTPFDLRPHTQKELEDAYSQMMGRIESLKNNLIRAMGEHGAALGSLRPEDHLTVVIHLLQVDLGGNRSVPSQIQLKMTRSLVGEYRENKLPLGDLVKKTEIVQY
jgi:hypothetical protein